MKQRFNPGNLVNSSELKYAHHPVIKKITIYKDNKYKPFFGHCEDRECMFFIVSSHHEFETTPYDKGLLYIITPSVIGFLEAEQRTR